MKFLVDECLSLELTKIARAAGYGESMHVVWLALNGTKDWNLMPIIVEGDWTFVTKNSDDFRGPRAKPGSKGHYATVELHAGLVCLNGPPTMDLAMQVELFEKALVEIERNPDMVNDVLEIDWGEDDLGVRRYQVPA